VGTANHFNFNIFLQTTPEAMSSYEDRFLKISVAFHALYLEHEVGEPQFFFFISDTGNAFSDCSKSMKKKICVVEDFRANVLKRLKYLDFAIQSASIGLFFDIIT